jgi:hypothetical protein
VAAVGSKIENVKELFYLFKILVKRAVVGEPPREQTIRYPEYDGDSSWKAAYQAANIVSYFLWLGTCLIALYYLSAAFRRIKFL